MYERLSSRVNEVIKLANAFAREYEQEYVGTEHVLLGIVREGAGLGAKIISEAGGNESRVRAEVDKLIKASLEDTWVFGRLPGTPHFRNVMARAIEEARALNSAEVGTEHLLLGLLVEKGSVAYEVLKTLGLSAKSVRSKVTEAAKKKAS